jgi:flavin-dependent dehydrogenase
MMFLFPGGYFGAVNVTDNVANIAMVVSRKLAQLLPADFSGFLEKTVMSNAVARSELASFQPFSNPATTFPINPAIHCSRYASAFLIGDARRTVEPFTGRGILVALWDGIRKGQELTALISGQRQHIERLVRRSWAEPVLSFVLRNPRFGGGLVSASTMVPVLRNSVARAIFGQNSAS